MADIRKQVIYEVEINDKGKVKIEGITKGFVEAKTALKSLNAELDKTNNTGLNPMIDKTGLAGATVTELGRTISDANYGIRGMANNLQQLSSLFVTLISTTGGLTKGLAALWNVLKGPLGIVIVIQTLITLLEGGKISIGLFSKEVRALNSALVDGAKAVGGEVGELELLVDIAKDESLSRKDRQDAVNKINESYPEYLENLTLEKINTEETSTAIRKQTELLVARAKVQALTNIVIKESEKIFEAQAKIQNQSAEQYASFLDFAGAFVMGMGNAQDSSAKLAEYAFASQNKTIQKAIKLRDLASEEIKNIMRSTPQVFASTNKSTKKAVDKLAELLDKYKQKLKESEAISRAELLKVQRDAVLRQARLLGASIKQLEPIIKFFASEINKAVETETQKAIADNRKRRLDAIKQELKDTMSIINAAKTALGQVGDVFLSYNDARMEALKRERDYVLNSGKITGAAQIKAIEDIEKRERKAQITKIKLERDLFTVKQTLLIAEQIAKAKATAEQLAIDSIGAAAAAKMSIGQYVKQLGPAGKIAYALSIGGILASIIAARKKAQAAISALGAPAIGGGGGGGAGVEAPDFNVVGASPESQLAQSVSQQQTQPLRAFVVHKDIKNANDLDRTITTTSSLG